MSFLDRDISLSSISEANKRVLYKEVPESFAEVQLRIWGEVIYRWKRSSVLQHSEN